MAPVENDMREKVKKEKRERGRKSEKDREREYDRINSLMKKGDHTERGRASK